jgi:hypothetical protein
MIVKPLHDPDVMDRPGKKTGFGLFCDGEDGEQIQTGDEVFWTDPDQGKCSRHLIVQTIEIRQCMSVRIVDVEGGELECFASELS